MIETWAVILIAVIVSLGVLTWAVQKWKKYKRKYFTDESNDDEDNEVSVEALEFTLDGEGAVVSSSNKNSVDNDGYMTTPRGTLKRTNSF